MTAFRTISLPVMWCHTMSWSQNNSPQSGDMNYSSKKEFKMQPSVVKVMCTVFWDRKEVILLDFLKSGQSINFDHNIAMLSKLKAQTSEVKPENKTAFLLQHDNTRPHSSLKTRLNIANLGCTVPPHSQYSPDLMPS